MSVSPPVISEMKRFRTIFKEKIFVADSFLADVVVGDKISRGNMG